MTCLKDPLTKLVPTNKIIGQNGGHKSDHLKPRKNENDDGKVKVIK